MTVCAYYVQQSSSLDGVIVTDSKCCSIDFYAVNVILFDVLCHASVVAASKSLSRNVLLFLPCSVRILLFSAKASLGF